MTLTLASWWATAQAQIFPAHSMAEAAAIIEERAGYPADTLIAFDIDHTLTTPQHPGLYRVNKNKYIDSLRKALGSLSSYEKDQLLCSSLLVADQILVESDTPNVVRSLQEKDYKVIAFTAGITGRVADIERFEEWRHEELTQLGFDFDCSSIAGHVVVDSVAPLGGNHPALYKGILNSNGSRTKGIVLSALLKQLQYSPKQIIMIDDKRSNLEDIEAALAKDYPGVEFVGVEYFGESHALIDTMTEEEYLDFWEGQKAKLGT